MGHEWVGGKLFIDEFILSHWDNHENMICSSKNSMVAQSRQYHAPGFSIFTWWSMSGKGKWILFECRSSQVRGAESSLNGVNIASNKEDSGESHVLLAEWLAFWTATQATIPGLNTWLVRIP